MELILVSYIADLIFGDPQWFPHPVRIMARLISFLDRKLNGSVNEAPRAKARGLLERNTERPFFILALKGKVFWPRMYKGTQRFWGILSTLSVVSISGLCAYLIIELAGRIHPLIGKIAWVFLAYTTLATKDLAMHAHAVWKRVVKGDIEGARKKLSLMVGRDTGKLSQDAVIHATVETVAESTTDGIVAPLFYLFLGGPVLAVMFKAVSTLDSMLGHKDEKYLDFGWFAAKLDEVANYLPARITGLLIPLAALLSGKDVIEGFRIMLRDAKTNSAISEAAMAGALGVRLGGTCSYSGRIVEYPYLGEEKRLISAPLIKEATVISVISSLLMLLIGIMIQQVVLRLVRL